MTWPWQKKWDPEISGIISSGALYRKLRKLHPEAQVICMDREYQIPADPSDVIWHYFPFNLLYIKGKRDCEDFTRIVRGELSKDARGDLLVMDCVIDYPDGRHDLLAFLVDDHIEFGEPQTGKMRTFSTVKIIRLIA